MIIKTGCSYQKLHIISHLFSTPFSSPQDECNPSKSVFRFSLSSTICFQFNFDSKFVRRKKKKKHWKNIFFISRLKSANYDEKFFFRLYKIFNSGRKTNDNECKAKARRIRKKNIEAESNLILILKPLNLIRIS